MAVDVREALAPALEEGATLAVLVRVVQERLPPALGLEAGVLWIRDMNRRRFVGAADLGLEPGTDLAFRDELPLRVQSLTSSEWTPDRGLKGETPFSGLFDSRARALLAVPILEEGHLLGVMAFASARPVPDDRPLEFARAAASLLAAPIRRGLVQLTLQEDFKLQQEMRDLVRRISGNDLKLGAFFQRVFWIVEKIMPVDAMFVTVKGEDGRLEVHLETDLDDRDHRIFFPVPRIMTAEPGSVIATISQHPYVLLLRRPEELALAPEGSMIGNSGRISASLLFAPIWCGDDYAGAVSIQSYRLNAYRHADAERILLLTDYLALAVQTSRLLDRARGS